MGVGGSLGSGGFGDKVRGLLAGLVKRKRTMAMALTMKTSTTTTPHVRALK